MISFSVLMSVYAGDNPRYLDQAIESIYEAQIVKPGQIVLVIDGPVPDELEAVIRFWSARLLCVLDVIRLELNVGLARALNAGLKHCRFDFVARMDSDDISLSNRFLNQTNFIAEHQDVDILGGTIEEVCPETLDTISIRKVPVTHDDIYSMSLKRNPMSHPSVMFRKASVLKLGGYPEFRKSQDYALWSLMLVNGCKFANLPTILLKMRAGRGLIRRRGYRYFIAEIEILRFQKNIRLISSLGYWQNFFIRMVFRLSPNFIKVLLYKYARG